MAACKAISMTLVQNNTRTSWIDNDRDADDDPPLNVIDSDDNENASLPTSMMATNSTVAVDAPSQPMPAIAREEQIDGDNGPEPSQWNHDVYKGVLIPQFGPV